MTKADRTRQYIVEKSAPVFNKRGFAGTSLGDITAATRLSKGALYGNFANKEEIAVAVFRHSMEKVREAFFKVVSHASSNRGKVEAFLDFYLEYVFNPPVPGGCPLMNSGVEADDHHVFLKEAVAREGRVVLRYLTKLLDDGKSEGDFERGTDSVALANLFFCAVEGAMVIARVTGSRYPMTAVVSQCKKILEQISTDNATT
jgi:AcrR family transcriptional regulator